jgi:hypothetical protein
MIRLRGHIRHEYAGKAKILTWHANQMRTEVARLRTEYPVACQEMEAELTALDLEAHARAEQLEERVRGLPVRRRKASPEPPSN